MFTNTLPGDIYDEIAAFGQQAEGQAARALQFAYAEISKYDAATHTARVKRKVGDQIEEVPHDLPILTPGVTKNGGVLMALEVGAPVLLLSMGLNGAPSFILPGWFTDNWGPPPAGLKEGEIWLVHKSGMSVRLNDKGECWIGKFDKDLDGDNAVVRKKDLQALIDWVNNTLLTAIKLHGHPPPGVGPPVNIAQFTNAQAAQASEKAKVE